ncbi:Protein N-acetyltransferase, RimJ/RimL family [Bifidobacterium bohemicum]|uniref:Acetyltransferase (GNAT) family n=1 Tax=Bifidobacterium bohemicum DSM 22767 TaxID=1437606 RepID=A0A086ZHJ3_9BIFI|nr:GNAT family N-acetyltransferase [Bifidobacterium bohemicum]KFI45993.1 acetyltransferase (GNAT) family [Bifidobacterium bohemicum DSM 22767]SCC04122.1 Protein N-acetyltransferase, RimJ/RimL family [Bifidobacterium bohemicum]
MSANSENLVNELDKRQLPERITIPEIKGEMVHLRPATLDDLPKLDDLQAFVNAAGDTGKDEQSERTVVQTWVKRSVAWMNGLTPLESGVGDPESRRTIAWSVLTDADHDADGKVDAGETDNVIGMVFLIDVDEWSRSARIQMMLGKDYRGRGYSRDTMPRVMTYGFAPTPSGLGMHRIWVAVPEKSSRTFSVYQSLGFIHSGTSRDALWDDTLQKYQNLMILDTLADEYDPIRSLDAFGMHVIEGNPGVREAMAAHEHTVEIERDSMVDDHAGAVSNDGPASNDGATNWPFSATQGKTSKKAWWRTIGRNGHSRDKADDPAKNHGEGDRKGCESYEDDASRGKGGDAGQHGGEHR